MKNKSIMVQGTGSSVGKSILSTALCRIFAQDGYKVCPFKSQNMSNNSYVTYEGDEMGRAQVMQAEAAGRVPSAVMNPILLKPASDRKSQVVINGKVYDTMGAEEYFNFKSGLKDMISSLYHRLEEENDIVVIEGAGSPAEINLKQNDLVNMGMAKIARSPVILAGDIDRGGVFAALAGTMLLLDDDEKRIVKGVVINKFRGSREILDPGLNMLEDIIKVPVLGVIPYFSLNLEDEDSVTDWVKFEDGNGELDIAVVKLPHISNFTDFNVLRLHKDVNLRFVDLDGELARPDVIMIPGTKSTITDMEMLKNSGMADKIVHCHKNGSVVFGICGGFQILGEEIRDPDHVESFSEGISGLGLLRSVTTFRGKKTTTLSEGTDEIFHCKVKGYEIHMGETVLLEGACSFIGVSRRNSIGTNNLLEGAFNIDKTVFGTYFHGIFDSSSFTRNFLNMIRIRKNLAPLPNSVPDYWEYKEEQYDKLAQIVRSGLDMERIYRIVEAGLNG